MKTKTERIGRTFKKAGKIFAGYSITTIIWSRKDGEWKIVSIDETIMTTPSITVPED